MFDTTDAACANTDVTVFFPEDPHSYVKDIQTAKNICSGCPLSIQCLAFAIENKEFGIWGGTTMEERKRMPLRKRNLIISQAKNQ